MLEMEEDVARRLQRRRMAGMTRIWQRRLGSAANGPIEYAEIPQERLMRPFMRPRPPVGGRMRGSQS
jgi:hypothetical protein